nr:potassium voltage-gated channel subfamily KQT member 5 [Hydra vulgaris]
MKKYFLIVSRKDWNKIKFLLYNILDKTGTKSSFIYNIIVFLFLAGAVILHIVSTVNILEENFNLRFAIFVYDFFVLIFFGFEFVIRLFVCSANVRYCGIRGRLIYIKKVYTLIDILVIVSSVVIIVLHYNESYRGTMHYANYFQILRLVRIDRTKGHLETMWQAIYSHRKELLTCYFSCISILVLGTYIIFLMESQSEPTDHSIDNMMNGLYWGIVTFTTTGYGDYAPQTWYGQLITGLLCMIGCAFFALPAGILGSGFALQVSKKKKEKGSIKVKNPAAILIQCAWRNYAVKNLNSKATWKYVISKIAAEKEKANAAKQLSSRVTTFSNLNTDDHINSAGIIQSSNLKTPKRKDHKEKSKTNGAGQPNYDTTSNYRGISLIRSSDTRIVKSYDNIDHVVSAGIIENSSCENLRRNYQIAKFNEKTNANKKVTISIDHVNSVGIIENRNLKTPKKIFNNKNLRQKSFKNKTNENCFDELVDIFLKHNQSECWSAEIPFKYKFLYNFISILKVILAVKFFSVTRHPYVNLEHILQINNLSLSCSSSLLREIKSTIGLIQSEIKDLQKEIQELKNSKNQRKYSSCIDNDNINLRY